MRRRTLAAILSEEVVSVRHWTDRLFSFVVTRHPSFRFQAGQFAMIGLELEGKPLMRAYSMTSAPFDDHLEFFSIKVPDGPLTSRLQHLDVNDRLLLGAKATGTLLADNLLPGRNLFLLGTGTGFAPFASIIRTPETYERFDRVIVVHGCRQVAELGYSADVVDEVRNSELTGELAAERLLYYPTATREAFRHRGRITTLLSNGALTRDLGLAPLDPEYDRVLLCGSPAMLSDLEMILVDRGFTGSTSSTPGTYAIERAFVEH
jgi:ferredoxin/flavodoxin---NADP+ reductase